LIFQGELLKLQPEAKGSKKEDNQGVISLVSNGVRGGVSKCFIQK
jgi:hypothetical protein